MIGFILENGVQVIHWLGALVVLVEALNKLERIDLFDGKTTLLSRIGGLMWLVTPWRWKQKQTVLVLKMLGWCLLAMSAGGVVVSPLMHLPTTPLHTMLFTWGFALLIIRTRLKEQK